MLDVRSTRKSAMPNQSNYSLSGLGAVVYDGKVYLVFTESDNLLHLAESKNGTSFQNLPQTLNVQDFIPDEEMQRVHLTQRDETLYLTFLQNGNLCLFATNELLHFGKLAEIPDIHATGMLVPNYKKSGKHTLIYGDDVLRMATSTDLLDWKTQDIPLLSPSFTSWEEPTDIKLSVATIETTPQGIVLIYYITTRRGEDINYSLQAVLLDKKDPRRLLWQSEILWENTEDWARGDITPVGCVFFHGRLLSYWNHGGKSILTIQHASLTRIFENKLSQRDLFLRRVEGEPVISPSERNWENRATFNPGAILKDEKVHLVYRAIGDEDTSVIGYARSDDGLSITKRGRSPSFVPQNFIKHLDSRFSKYNSGGGFGGCEDPRITQIDGKIYMTYVAFDGVSPPRVALTSIPEDDFFTENWNWSEPVFISRPGMVNKNAVLFPEKINGKYVIMHRVFPHLLLDYWDDLEFDGKKFLRGDHKISPRPLFWDSRKIGAGPPPLKTDAGWLLIYHGVGDQDAGRYKVGAMLLDLQKPERVIARSYHPILTPDHRLENEGHKAGVVYPCGAVIRQKKLIVYYGGADTVTLAATADTDEFLEKLLDAKMPFLKTVTLSN